MPPRCWGVKGRGRGKFPADIWCIDDLFKGRFCPVPRGPLAHWSLLRVGWKQAGPHASGRDEPGQIGRSSPKSWFRVPWQARPFCAAGAEGPGSPTVRTAPAACAHGSALACAPSGGPLHRARRALFRDPHGRTRSKPGPLCATRKEGRASHPFALRSCPSLLYLRIGAADLEPARHTLYSGHPPHVLRCRIPGQSPRMPRWLRAKS